MSLSTEGPAEPKTFRPRSSALLTGFGWALVAGFVAAHWFASGAAAGLEAVPLGLAAAYLVWLVFWDPHLSVGPRGVDVVNPFREIDVPWEALVDVSTQYALTLVTPRGRFRAWAAPGPGRHKIVYAGPNDVSGLPRTTYDGQRSVQLGDLPGSSSGAAGELVRRRWEELVEHELIEIGVADTTPVPVRWRSRQLTALGALTVVGLALVLLA
jgi:hypothetical protein